MDAGSTGHALCRQSVFAATLAVAIAGLLSCQCAAVLVLEYEFLRIDGVAERVSAV